MTTFKLFSILVVAALATNTVSAQNLTEQQLQVIDNAFQPSETAEWSLDFKKMTSANFDQNILPNLPNIETESVIVDVAPDKNDASKKVATARYIDGTPVLDQNSGEPIAVTLPKETPIVVAHSEAEVKANKGAFIVFVQKALSNVSIAGGVTRAQEADSSIWWQKGLPNTIKLISPSFDVQYSLAAESVFLLNRLPTVVAHNLYFDFGVIYIGKFSSDAVATSTGWDNPYKYPVYRWEGHGDERGAYAAIRVNMPKGFYVSTGALFYRNHWTMHVAQVPNCPAGMQCPSINESVDGPAKTQLGLRITLGKKITEHASIECSYLSSGDNENVYPPIWHKFSYNCMLRERL